MFINKINNKKYVGQAKNFLKRYNSHMSESANSTTEKRKYYNAFHSAIRKYGIENFEIVILKKRFKNTMFNEFLGMLLY